MSRSFSGERLRAARKAAGLKPERLALNVDRSVYSILEYERGRSKPSVTVLAHLADVLAVSTDFLFIEGAGADESR